jgi:hypothetical protein
MFQHHTVLNNTSRYILSRGNIINPKIVATEVSDVCCIPPPEEHKVI